MSIHKQPSSYFIIHFTDIPKNFKIPERMMYIPIRTQIAIKRS